MYVQYIHSKSLRWPINIASVAKWRVVWNVGQMKHSNLSRVVHYMSCQKITDTFPYVNEYVLFKDMWMCATGKIPVTDSICTKACLGENVYTVCEKWCTFSKTLLQLFSHVNDICPLRISD